MGVLFRVEAGFHQGLGHLQRCLSLAAALQQMGIRCVFAVNLDEVVRRRVTAGGCQIHPMAMTKLGQADDATCTLEVAQYHGCQVIVVDSYDADTAYLDALLKEDQFVVAIDDEPLFPFPCQMVVNGSIGAEGLPYRSGSSQTHFLLGSKYAMLQPEFYNLPPRAIRRQVDHLLITLGGSDTGGLMYQLLQLVDGCSGDFAVTALIGPFFGNHRELERGAASCGRTVQLLGDLESISPLMQQADLAISAGGQTLYELAATSTPTVAISIADNQRINLDGFARAGAIWSVRSLEEPGSFERLTEAVQELLHDPQARAALAGRARQLIDGQGAERVARELMQLAQARVARSTS